MASGFCPGNVGKQAWPELLGAQVSVAVARIYRENSNVRPIVVPEGLSVTEDIRCDRVRVWVEGRIVSRVPIVG
ncbi:hypothetical protein Syun_010470 [Stephania yunnanensis]|uniref:Uncharacterized protein n=1 Tax=Stephania yunnanensis TaxID=152371 RepID=A0AAP0KGK7_9MAGN